VKRELPEEVPVPDSFHFLLAKANDQENEQREVGDRALG